VHVKVYVWPIAFAAATAAFFSTLAQESKSMFYHSYVRFCAVFLAATFFATAMSCFGQQGSSPNKEVTNKQDQPAITRAKNQAKMLDTLYKSAIVLITENYVDGKESLAAGDAFQALFKTMKDNGFHEVRLLDATGDAYDPDNEPKTDFEKKAVKSLLDGAAIYEQLATEGDKRYLLSATPIPVVMEKCTICHVHYAGVKGPIGALGLKIPLE
jgi:hypothetical protein